MLPRKQNKSVEHVLSSIAYMSGTPSTNLSRKQFTAGSAGKTLTARNHMAHENTVRLAIQGCCHGSLSSIYDSLDEAVELLIICGDFQALRNTTDYCTISVPPKYLQMGDFHQYYSGERVAPITTVFIGGNHESSLYMTELQYGGWVAPNIYYLGKFGSIWFRGLQIGGWSGIFNETSFNRNLIGDALLPYSPSTLRLVYHHTPISFLKMCLLDRSLDIVMSHDWPRGIEQFGNTQKLIKQKPFFRKEIESNLLGNPLSMFLLQSLRPLYWFSAHLHIGFQGVVNFDQEKDSQIASRDELSSACDQRTAGSLTLKGLKTTDDNQEIMLDMDSEPEQEALILDIIELGLDNMLPGTMSKRKEDTLTVPGSNESVDDGPHAPKKDASPCENESTNLRLDFENGSSNLMEITIDMDDMEADSAAASHNQNGTLSHSNGQSTNQSNNTPRNQANHSCSTKFHALDKCGRNRHLIEVINFPVKEENLKHPSRATSHLYHSIQAIAINKVVQKYIEGHRSSFESIDMSVVAKDPYRLAVVEELRPLVNSEIRVLQLRDLSTYIIGAGSFMRVCPTSLDSDVPLQWWRNPQTDSYCAKFGIAPPELRCDAAQCSATVSRTLSEISGSSQKAREDNGEGRNTTAKKFKKFRKNWS